jgi:hypothetical protein
MIDLLRYEALRTLVDLAPILLVLGLFSARFLAGHTLVTCVTSSISGASSPPKMPENISSPR